MPSHGNILILGPPQRATPLAEALQARGYTPVTGPLDAAPATGRVRPLAAVLLTEATDVGHCDPDAPSGAVLAQLQALAEQRICPLVWGNPPPTETETPPDWVPATATVAEIVGRVETLARYAPALQRLNRELDHMQRLGTQLNHYFAEIDQEMRLAGRLQRDFLPRQLPDLPGLSFYATYRPASWVSGDLYDVFRIDEEHVGLFIADAMGHGVAAGFLTMFLRQGLQVKTTDAETYHIVPPAEALLALHANLVRQKLPRCQFVTATYGVLHVPTNTLRLARGGHPYAIRLSADGAVQELQSEGGLIGLTDVPCEIEELTVTLSAGDRLLFYTDGLEHLLLAPPQADQKGPAFTPDLAAWATLPGAVLLRAIEERLDNEAGSLHPRDDVTAMIVELGDAGSN